MWAVSSIPSPTPSTTAKSPRAYGPVTVSAKPRPRQNQKYNHFDDDEDGTVIKFKTPSGNAPISKNPKQLKGEDIDSDVSWKSQEGNNSSAEDIGGLSGAVVSSGNPKESPDSEEKAGVGGSDILWALLQASAKKAKAVKQREIPAEVASKIKDGNRKDEDYYRNVKPLRIRADWSSRLDDLERRLKELIDS